MICSAMRRLALKGALACAFASAVSFRLARRGVTIVTESVNTRMAAAKPVLDAAYDTLGLPPAHGITELRIAIQNLRQVLCTAIFTPSPATEHAFLGTRSPTG